MCFAVGAAGEPAMRALWSSATLVVRTFARWPVAHWCTGRVATVPLVFSITALRARGELGLPHGRGKWRRHGACAQVLALVRLGEADGSPYGAPRLSR